MGETITLHGDGRRGTGEDEWAGRDYQGLGAVRNVETSRWNCLMCPQTGSGSTIAVRYAAEEHARTERHLAEVTTSTTLVPEETSCG